MYTNMVSLSTMRRVVVIFAVVHILFVLLDERDWSHLAIVTCIFFFFIHAHSTLTCCHVCTVWRLLKIHTIVFCLSASDAWDRFCVFEQSLLPELIGKPFGCVPLDSWHFWHRHWSVMLLLISVGIIGRTRLHSRVHRAMIGIWLPIAFFISWLRASYLDYALEDAMRLSILRSCQESMLTFFLLNFNVELRSRFMAQLLLWIATCQVVRRLLLVCDQEMIVVWQVLLFSAFWLNLRRWHLELLSWACYARVYYAWRLLLVSITLWIRKFLGS